MLNRYLAGFFYAACTLAALTSCGDAKSSGTAELSTVFAIVTPPPGLDSDVATWVDATSGSKAPACGPNSAITILPDDVNYTVTSSAYTTPNTGSTSPIIPSDLLVENITLTFTPANSLSPALPAMFQTQYPSAGQRIVVGSTNISVRVSSHELKTFFMTGLGNQSIDCSNQPIYSYWVNATFRVHEVNTGRVATISPQGPLLMRVADFADK